MSAPAHAVGAPSVKDDGTNHDLVLTWWDYGSADPLTPTVEVRIPVEHLIGFMQQVANVGGSILSGAITDIAAGECATCSNTGMVDEPIPHGRGKWSVHCPDCGPRPQPTDVLRNAPRVRPSGFRED